MNIQLKYIQDTIAFISEKGYERDSNEFLKSTATFLAKLFGVNYVLIDKYSMKNPTQTQTILIYSKGKFLPNIIYNLKDTPCQKVINKKLCSFPANAKTLFPKDKFLSQNNIESYIGIPLWSSKKEAIGLIALMDEKPVNELEIIENVLGIIGIKVEEVLEKMLLENQLNLKIEELKIAIALAGEREEKLKEVQKIANIGSYALDISSGLWESSTILNIIFGIDEDYVKDVETWLKIIHPKDRDAMKAYLETNIFKKHEFFDRQYQIICVKDSHEKWVHGHGKLEFDKNGNPVKMIGTIQDITSQKTLELQSKEARETAEKNEEKFKKLTNLIFEGIVLAENGTAIECNNVFLEMFGYSREEVLGKDVKKLVIPNKYHEIINKKTIEKHTYPFEIEGLRKDGATFPIEIEARNIDLGNANFNRLVSFRDIASRKKIQTENKKLSVAVEQSANTIVITDVHGNIEYTNPKFTEVTGYTATEALGKNPRILNSGAQHKDYYAQMWQTISAGKTWEGEFKNKAKNGNLFWEKVTITPIKDDLGKIINYLAIKEDITKNKEAAEEIEKSEKKFRDLFEKSGDAILIIKNSVFVECNQAALEMLGHEKYEDVLNLQPSELSPKFQPDGQNSNEKAEAFIKITLEKGTHRFEWWHTKRNGELFPVEVLLTTIENEPKNKVIHCVWRDIISRKEADQKLQNQNEEYRILTEDYLIQNSALQQLSNELSENNRLLLETKHRFENLFEHSPVSLWEQDFSEVVKLLNRKKAEKVDLRTYFDENPTFINQCLSKIKILNVNKITLDLFGVKNIIELKALLTKTNNKKSLEVVKEEMLSIASNFKTFTGETEFTSTKGKIISAIVTSAIIDDYGKAIASVIDITDLKKAEIELLKAKEKAEESDRLKTEFIQNMSHEVRTPMNGILGFSELLDNPDLPEEKRKKFIEIIKSSTNQLLHIIEDIMEISVLETKQIVAEEHSVCLNDLLYELFNIFNIKATKKNTKLVLKNELSDQESMILTDKNKLNKVLSNLLENALKFTEEGIVELGYKLNKDSEPAELKIFVKDSGIGIKPEKQNLIFERFSQAEKDLSKKVGGLGLGLSIAKENAELLGGKISLISELGEGAAFFVTLPYKPVNLEPKIVREKAKTTDNKKKYTILVAEDEEINFMVLKILLEDKLKLPCTIIHAKDGLEAVEFCKNNPAIELVLMDIKMPKMDGHEATKRIKEFFPNMPIVAQTAYSTPEEKEKAFLAGCDDFISKPINKDELKKTLDLHLLN